MRQIYLNNKEILLGSFDSHSFFEKDKHKLFISSGIVNAKEYINSCKFKNIKPGDIIKVSSKNTFMKAEIEYKIKELESYSINPDRFLDKVAMMHFTFEVEQDAKENVVDLTL